jgi:spore maturation protein CgeB
MCRSSGFRKFIQRTILRKINEEIERIAKEFGLDLVPSIKGEAVEPKTIEWVKSELGAKTALWYPDDPRFFGSLVKCIAPSYEHVFTASERAVNMYREIGCENVHYLPFACEPAVHKRVELSDEERERYWADVVFVGTYSPRRAKLIKALENAGIKVKVYGPYWRYFKFGRNVYEGIYGPEMVKSFNAARIVLNIHVADDLEYKANMRTFEATGSGAFLLTDKPYGLEKLFAIGKELVAYKDEEELTDLVKFYLDAEDEREEIALRGMERALENHTYRRRTMVLLLLA